jgi:hypothetical protein
MSNNQTIKGKNLNPELVTVSEKPTKMDSGAKYVYVGYNNKNLVVQTPEMDMPFGLNVYDEGKYPKYSVDVSFKGVENNKSMKAFYDNLKAMDDRLISEGMKNSLSWLGKPKSKASREVIESMFRPTVKDAKDKNDNPLPYPARLKLKIPYKDDNCITQFYNKEGTLLTDDVSKILVRGTKAKVIMQCVGIWISAGSYMCQWKAVRMEVDVPETSDDSHFLPDTDDEDDESEEALSSTKSSKKTQKVEESDEEDDEEDDDEDDDEEDDEDDDAEESDEEESEDEPEPEPVKPKKSKGKGKGKSKK